MNPTARSFAPVGIADPELAEALEATAPFEASSGAVCATPANSCASSATVDALVVTVMLVTEAAFAAYHISPSEFWPDSAYAPTFFQVFLPSVTAVIGLLRPVNTPAESTSRSPGVLGAGKVTVVVDEPAACTNLGPGGGAGVVTETAALVGETLPAPSRAATEY